MEYVKTELDSTLNIGGIYTVHYFEYMKDFRYEGERHPFWEIVYADRKNFIITAEDKEVRLEAGQLYLHKPDEFHNIRCDDSAANSVIISFECDCEELHTAAGRVIACGGEERKLIGSIIKESLEVFLTPLGNVHTRKMDKADGCAFGGQQLIRLYLEQLLIHLIRGTGEPVRASRCDSGSLFDDICKYLEINVENRLHFEDILKEFSVSASVIKRMFKSNTGCGVMEYFNRLKVDAAKQMIRETGYNFTEIAQMLSFNTSQYFTTVFRRVSGMTPSEYADSVTSKFTVGGN